MTDLLLPQNLIDQVMTIVDAIYALLVHNTDLLKDHNINEFHALTIDHVQTPETGNFRSTLRHIDFLQYQEILDLPDLDHILL